MLSEKIVHFLFNLQMPEIPVGIEVLDPFADSTTQKACKQFYNTYYNDNQPRYCIIGINPGRFGAGITGVPFTDPIRLQNVIGIENPWQKKQELSSVFIYEMIEAYGGVQKFYNDFYITAISPLGFVQDGKNINYYDNKTLQANVLPFAVACLKLQLGWGLHPTIAFCLGEGKNFRFLKQLNEEHKFFSKIIPLPHPRFIMQYRRKSISAFVQQYINAFSTATGDLMR